MERLEKIQREYGHHLDGRKDNPCKCNVCYLLSLIDTLQADVKYLKSTASHTSLASVVELQDEVESLKKELKESDISADIEAKDLNVVIHDLQSRLYTLLEAFKKYGVHLDMCPRTNYGGPCMCGFIEAAEKAKEKEV